VRQLHYLTVFVLRIYNAHAICLAMGAIQLCYFELFLPYDLVAVNRFLPFFFCSSSAPYILAFGSKRIQPLLEFGSDRIINSQAQKSIPLIPKTAL
jgi:hypothetical protein